MGSLYNKLQLERQRFGRLVVLYENGRDKKRSVLWRCQCDCGNKITVSADSLRTGNTKSCGCYQKDRASETSRLPDGQAAFNYAFGDYKKRASKLNLTFELGKDDFRRVTQRDCFYCGAKPTGGKTDKRARHGKYIRNGIDRIDNTKGYTSDNVVSCCKTCNIMKKAMDIGEFLGRIARIAQKHKLLT